MWTWESPHACVYNQITSWLSCMRDVCTMVDVCLTAWPYVFYSSSKCSFWRSNYTCLPRWPSVFPVDTVILVKLILNDFSPSVTVEITSSLEHKQEHSILVKQQLIGSVILSAVLTSSTIMALEECSTMMRMSPLNSVQPTVTGCVQNHLFSMETVCVHVDVSVYIFIVPYIQSR